MRFLKNYLVLLLVAGVLLSFSTPVFAQFAPPNAPPPGGQPQSQGGIGGGVPGRFPYWFTPTSLGNTNLEWNATNNSVRLRGENSGYVELKAPADGAATTYTFPPGDGLSGQVLSTDGLGALTWSAGGAGGAGGVAVGGTGSDGALDATDWGAAASITITSDKNYTSITIPAGKTLIVNGGSRPIRIYSRGNVIVDGIISTAGYGLPGGGGGAAPSSGIYNTAGATGGSFDAFSSGGSGGTGYQSGGGGAGLTSAGSGSGYYGFPVASYPKGYGQLPNVIMAPGTGGGGGGGNSTCYYSCQNFSGGAGGNGGGALMIETPGSIAVSSTGRILADGGKGSMSPSAYVTNYSCYVGYSYQTIPRLHPLDSYYYRSYAGGGTGGGGGGGTVYLRAGTFVNAGTTFNNTSTFVSNGNVSARGGAAVYTPTGASITCSGSYTYYQYTTGSSTFYHDNISANSGGDGVVIFQKLLTSGAGTGDQAPPSDGSGTQVMGTGNTGGIAYWSSPVDLSYDSYLSWDGVAKMFTVGNTTINGLTNSISTQQVKTTALQVTGGSPGTDKILVSDGVGNARWVSNPWIWTSGTSTTNYVPKWGNATTLTDSQIFDNGVSVGIGTNTPDPTKKLDVNGDGQFSNLDVAGTLSINGQPLGAPGGEEGAGGTGADGPLHITSGQTVTITTDKNYSSITIDAGGTLRINGHLLPIRVHSKGNVLVNGTITSDGAGGAGGYGGVGNGCGSWGAGGPGEGLGLGNYASTGGTAGSPGGSYVPSSNYCGSNYCTSSVYAGGAGGGGAGFTSGVSAPDNTATSPTIKGGVGGAAHVIGYPYVATLMPGTGGAGGAGGVTDTWQFRCPQTTFGPRGGAGGGAFMIDTPGSITVNSTGKITANGLNQITDGFNGTPTATCVYQGGNAFSCSGWFYAGSAAGGGGGGTIYLRGSSYSNAGTVTASGGSPGGGAGKVFFEKLTQYGSGGAATAVQLTAGSTNAVAVWSSASDLYSDNRFYWDNGTGRLGVGNSAPQAELDVTGKSRTTTFQMTGGSPGSGKVLISDANGNATWVANPWGSGTQNMVAKWGASNTILNSQIFDNGTNVGVGTMTPTKKFEVAGDTQVTNLNVTGNLTINGTAVGASGGNGSALRFTRTAISYGAPLVQKDSQCFTEFGSNYTVASGGEVAAYMTYGGSGYFTITDSTYAYASSGGNISGSFPFGVTYVPVACVKKEALLRFTRTAISYGATLAQKDSQCSSEFGTNYTTASAAEAAAYIKYGGSGYFTITDSTFAYASSGGNISGSYPFGVTYVPVVCINKAAEGGGGATQWVSSGSNIYYNVGNVGINKSTPAQKLDVGGNINASGLCIGGDCRTSWASVSSGGASVMTLRHYTPPNCPGGWTSAGTTYWVNAANSGYPWVYENSCYRTDISCKVMTLKHYTPPNCPGGWTSAGVTYWVNDPSSGYPWVYENNCYLCN